jgi:hypothetical protein
MHIGHWPPSGDLLARNAMKRKYELFLIILSVISIILIIYFESQKKVSIEPTAQIVYSYDSLSDVDYVDEDTE